MAVFASAPIRLRALTALTCGSYLLTKTSLPSEGGYQSSQVLKAGQEVPVVLDGVERSDRRG
jgi:hypothetical protein